MYYCKSCGHYDTWWERRPLPAAIRQIFIGTILVGILGVLVNVTADALIKDSDERQAALERELEAKRNADVTRRERELAAAETLHEEVNALRESLIRIVYRMTNDTIRCPFAGTTDGTGRCLEHVRRLRQELRQDLYAMDWTAPLLFAQLDAMGNRETGSASAVEAALDIATTVGKDYGDVVDGLDVRWANECIGEHRSPACAEIQECRRRYASAETRCVTFAACLAFGSESTLLAGITDAPPYESTGCASMLQQRSECGDPEAIKALPDLLCRGVLPTASACPASWAHFDEHCRSLAPH